VKRYFFRIEKGIWLGLERNDRKCQLCNLNEKGDEYHYIHLDVPVLIMKEEVYCHVLV